MTDVTPELLPEHPILELRATETRNDLGIMAGEVLAYRCRECGASDEDVVEIIHEGDCRLSGRTAPTAYADRVTSFDGAAERRDVATDGGPEQ